MTDDEKINYFYNYVIDKLKKEFASKAKKSKLEYSKSAEDDYINKNFSKKALKEILKNNIFLLDNNGK